MDNVRQILTFDDKEEMAGFMAEKWRSLSVSSVGERGCFVVALSGGTTPVPLYRALAAHRQDIPWDRTHLFLADERFVPAASPESNLRLIRETLLKGIALPARNVHAIATDDPDPPSAARRYEGELITFFRLSRGELPRFDLIILGMGSDGHTASLFPGSPALRNESFLACAVAPAGGRLQRITLTLPVLNNARNVVFLVSGAPKAAMLRTVVEDEDPALPAVLVKPERGSLLILADRDASRLLKEGARFASQRGRPGTHQ
ncbi:MAG: 6-phosphogluconolactonase [Thermodesulfovibrionales bacterium]